jgi:hypothetical protein
MEMRKLLVVTTALVALAVPAHAQFGKMSKADIDALPQDSVAAIRRQCERDWGTDFGTRLYCEDQQYQALKALIDRGSVKGDSR